MLTQRALGTISSLLIATMAMITPAQAEHKRHSGGDATVAIIAGAAIATVGYLAYKNQHRHNYKKNRYYKKRHHNNRGYDDDRGHYKKKYIQREHYSNDHTVKSYRGNSHSNHYRNKRYSYKKRYYHDSPKHYGYKQRYYRYKNH